jgi:hypothetical protein
MAKRKRVNLKGVLQRTATWVEIADDGTLIVEFFDFSDAAQGMFGGDVAYLTKVSPDDKLLMLAALLADAAASASGDADSDDRLLRLIAEKFVTYFQVREWLQKKGIPYHAEFDGRA